MKTVKVSKDDLNFLVNKIRYGILPKYTGYDEIVASIIELFSEDANLSNSENIGKNLKPFNLEAAKAGKPVCTKDGRKARIICFDRNDLYPIVALIECEDGKEIIGAYSKEGQTEIYEIKGTDLMMLPEKKEGWVNVYKETTGEYYMDKIIHKTKKFALDVACPDDYIDTVKIEWEE